MFELAQFHFLRPLWLLGLLPAALTLWIMLKNSSDGRVWHGVISTHLRPHLTVRHGFDRGIRPIWLLSAGWLLVSFALAGPTWQRQPSPFSQDQAALVIALKVTPEMLARDVQPSRLQRSIQKIHDLLALRPGARAAFIAYAGSAHLVMPLTTDANIIESFASALVPEVMPLPGDAGLEAILLGNRILQQADVAGSILLIADSFASSQTDELSEIRAKSGYDVHVLAVAAGAEVIPPVDSPPAAPLDTQAMARLADAGGGSLEVVTFDDADVRALSRSLTRSLARAPAQEGERWRDEGYFIVPFVGFALLLLFRRGSAAALE